uniref:Cysteine-rich protein n=1 Tax=Spironucleus salmonicida TaxID=348837 RepID=V6LM15_9EUKA|eukprot:EST44751.1 Cysteine-rich protein [Spironucleus salmonicida]
MGTDCMQCQEGFVFENSQCLQICDTCNGKDCVVQLRIEICFGACFTGYIGDSCQVCDAPNGYFPVLSWCYQKCDTCVYGECFNTESGDVICTSCYDNRVGTQCNNCLDGYILAMEKCQKQVTEDKCFLVDVDLICIGCRPGKVLADATCHDVCLYPSCQGTCYLTDVSFICLDCYNGFLLVDQKCYEQTENPKGDCYIKSEEIICICYPGFSGVDCSSCIGIIQNERCYIRDGSITSGTCYKDALDAMDKFCQTCQYNYQLPLCQECSPGYEIDLVAMTCSVCATGYLDSNLLPPDQLSQVGPDRCIAKCVSCLNGDCYYQGDAIFCIQCKRGMIRLLRAKRALPVICSLARTVSWIGIQNSGKTTLKVCIFCRSYNLHPLFLVCFSRTIFETSNSCSSSLRPRKRRIQFTRASSRTRQAMRSASSRRPTTISSTFAPAAGPHRPLGDAGAPPRAAHLPEVLNVAPVVPAKDIHLSGGRGAAVPPV